MYGQPIHTYSPYRTTAAAAATAAAGAGDELDGDGPPTLERMDDDEYAAYVRGKMWERSHAYVVEGAGEAGGAEGARAGRGEARGARAEGVEGPLCGCGGGMDGERGGGWIEVGSARGRAGRGEGGDGGVEDGVEEVCEWVGRAR